MAMNWPTFFTRLGSAIVFCAVMMTGLLWNEWSFLVLLVLIQVLCIREYFRLMKKIYPQHNWPSWVHIALQVASFACLISNTSLPAICEPYIGLTVIEPDINIVAILGLLVLIISISLITCAIVVAKQRKAVAYTFLGWLYIALPMLALSEFYISDELLPLMIILMIWCNDTLAYLVGSFIGKTPLTKISPKKTWEGTAGGVILTLVSVGVWATFKETNYTVIQWLGLAFVVAIAGTFGDLLESKLKRMAGVKDSGAMMPGHGGALDRFDSLLIATPFAFVYASFIMM